ncbi:MAG TPA: hypothetical protein VGO47_09110 [Chlamydiales bacterium]|nr:hypothetical protein [Chlamydiales bacterium]
MYNDGEQQGKIQGSISKSESKSESEYNLISAGKDQTEKKREKKKNSQSDPNI